LVLSEESGKASTKPFDLSTSACRLLSSALITAFIALSKVIPSFI